MARGTRAIALLVHRFFETGHVDGQTPLARNVGRQIDGKTIRVVKAEGVSTRDLFLCFRRHFVEHLHSVFQRLAEPLFFRQQCLLDQTTFGGKLRISRSHFLDERRNHLEEKRFAHAEHVAMTQRAADDSAQYITAPFVRWQHTIDDEERARTNMIGDHAQRFVFQIVRLRELCRNFDQMLKQIDFIVRVDVLQHRRQSFQAHASVDARRGQRRQRAIGRAIELHENEIPDFDEAIAVFVRRSRRTAWNFRSVIVENLRARTARSRVCHLPEIIRRERRTFVVADADDAIFRQSDFFVPQIVSFVVCVVDRDKQTIFRQSEHTREQLPRPDDRVALEIVAERPIAEHLEKRVMPRGVADRIQIVVFAARAQAALHVGRAHVRQFFAAEENVLELHHAGIGEQQRRIVAGHERRRGDDRVSLGFEEIEKRLADFGAGLHLDRFHRLEAIHSGACGRTPTIEHSIRLVRRCVQPFRTGD